MARGAGRAAAAAALLLLALPGSEAFLGPLLPTMGGRLSAKGPSKLGLRMTATFPPASEDLASIAWSPGLLAADILGIKPEIVGRESWAWSHSSRNEGSVVLQLTARIEAEGGKDQASPTLIRARRRMMSLLLQHDYRAYVQAATALGGLIDRRDLPNVQDVPYPGLPIRRAPQAEPRSLLLGRSISQEVSEELVPDCTLPNMTFTESLLDQGFLHLFRTFMSKETGFSSPIKGILGLIVEGKEFMLRPGQTPAGQQKMVYKVLEGLMTPVIPFIYHTTCTGILPNGKQIGPFPWASMMTSFVTPTFFSFLVGPNRPNRRVDGQLGGLIIDKCKLLQESGCKGLCMHQCKLPAEQFFTQHMGLPLTVTPNFESQECQWSFGEVPKPPDEDPRLPKGCLVGCTTREGMREAKVAKPCD